jgi:predicted aldo/keto reductase-like oxidoreductase
MTQEETHWRRVALPRTKLISSGLGLGSSFGLAAADIEHAYAHGLNYFCFGSARRPAFGRGVKSLCKQGQRERMVLVVQSYTRAAGLMRRSLESGLRSLGTEYADFLLLGWWNEPPPERIMDTARALRDAGLCKHIMISCHNRLAFVRHATTPGIDAVMVRYNASHPGAELEMFPQLAALPSPPAVIAYTATR